MANDPVDELFEGDLFFFPGMRPERFEGSLPILVDVKPEEVFQPTLFQRIALHVEEQVALNRLRHPVETTPFTQDRQKLEQRDITGAPLELQPRLISQLAQRLCLQFRDAQLVGTVRQLVQCGHAGTL